MSSVPDFTKCFIMYRVVGETVEIFRILHTAQDIDTILNDE
jgi:plasmid stabilization system protein ParE